MFSQLILMKKDKHVRLLKNDATPKEETLSNLISFILLISIVVACQNIVQINAEILGKGLFRGN